jgi:hypothetical protein
MSNCSTCGYQSPEGAKFCRQCGAPLYAESESSGADTRNYGRQDSAPAFSAPLPRTPSVVDAFGSETSRYYQAPAAAVAGTSNLPNVNPVFGGMAHGYAPPVSPTSPLKKKRRLLKWGGAALALIISAGIGAGINEAENKGRIYVSSQDRAYLDAKHREDQINGTLISATTESRQRIQEELAERLEAVQRAKEEAERAMERGQTGLDEPTLELGAFKYPGATSGQFSSIAGKELLTLRTKDDFDTITDYYQRKLGKPYLIRNERNRKSAIFQTNETPSATILVQETNDRNQEKISILRSPFRFPKPKDQAPVVVDKVESSERAGGKAEDKQPVPAKPAVPAAPKAPEAK